MNLSSLIAASQERLADAGVDNPALDARLLIGHALGLDRAALLTQSERVLTPEENEEIERLIERRSAREPVGRILGLREFWGLPFGLNEATLEPRPDTETLVEVALAVIKNRRGERDPSHIKRPISPAPASARIDFGRKAFGFLENGMPAFAGMTAEGKSLHLLDLGTGTGCLLLALLHELPDATGLGIDKAPRAVDQAQANAKRLGLEARATFQVGDWLENLDEKFDLIVSNPPYIPTRDIETLAPEVRLFDPLAALDGGVEGLDPYRLLIPRLPPFLNAGGLALFEVGIHQAPAVADLLRENGFEPVSIHADLGGIDRCVAGVLPR